MHDKLEEENIDDQDDILEIEEVCAFSWGRGATRLRGASKEIKPITPRVSLKGTRPPRFDILCTTPHYALLKPHHGSGTAVTLHYDCTIGYPASLWQTLSASLVAVVDLIIIYPYILLYPHDLIIIRSCVIKVVNLFLFFFSNKLCE